MFAFYYHQTQQKSYTGEKSFIGQRKQVRKNKLWKLYTANTIKFTFPIKIKFTEDLKSKIKSHSPFSK